MAPIDVSALGREGRDLNNAWKEAVRKHNRHTTRNEYFKRREMDEWSKELQAINSKYRQLFKELIAKKKAEAAEQERKEKEAAEAAARKAAEAAARKAARKTPKATEKATTRSVKKTAEAAARKASPKSEKKRTRCPNGTRKNKKTGECEKK